MQKILDNTVRQFSKELEQYSPCLYTLKNKALCGIAKGLHTTGHYGMKTGDHEGPQPPQEIFERVVIRSLEKKVHFCFIEISSISQFFVLECV